MGSSFVLFDVSMEITQRQFRSGKSGYTQKHRYPWENASYPWVKGLSVTTTGAKCSCNSVNLWLRTYCLVDGFSSITSENCLYVHV